MKRNRFLILILVFMLLPIVPVTEASFYDVEEDSPYYESIQFLQDEDIVHGRGGGLFYPNDNITRAEALKLLYDLKGLSGPDRLPANPDFPDVKQDSWYAPYVYLAKRKKTMTGTDEGNFEPDRNITRAESCKIILSTYGTRLERISDTFSNLHSFTDIDSDQWYSNCIGFADFYSLFPLEDSEYNPDKYITRGEFSLFLFNMYNFYNKGDLAYVNPEEEEESDFISGEIDLDHDLTDEQEYKLSKVMSGIGSYYSDWFNGKNTASGATFSNDKMIAAHPYLPFNTFVQVTNKDTGESVEVEILDCGPFVKGRVIDLSERAFSELSHTGAGLINVELKINKLGPHKFQEKCFELTQRKW